MKASIGTSLLIAISAIVAGWSSYTLYARAQSSILWGYLPLALFLSAWILLVAFFYKKNRLLAWSSLSGLLLGISFPGYIPVPFLMFGALVPLLFVEHEIEKSDNPRKVKNFAAHSFHTLLLWNIISTFWIADSSLPAGIFAIVVNSALMTIPFVLSHLTRRVMGRLGYAPLMAYWLVFEYLHYNWELNYPWLTLGNSFAQFPGMVQWYDVTGVLGGSLWILIANAFIFEILKRYQNQETYRGQALRSGAVLLVPTLYSLILYFIYTEKGNALEAVVVQPNLEPHYEEPQAPESTILTHNLGLARRSINENTDFLIFPEAVFGPIDDDWMDKTSTIEEFKRMTSQYPKLNIVAGLNAYHIFKPWEQPSRFVRTSESRTGETFQYETYNAALQVRPDSVVLPMHRKSKLVPGPESFPYKRYLSFLMPVVERLGGTTAGVATEAEPVVFANKTADIAPLICYESVFGEYVAQFVQRGAELIVIMTNDGWWDNTPGHRQHLYFASLRAIETRRSIARAANTGISAFINQRGDVLARTRYDEATTLTGQIRPNDRLTFYVRWGDMIGRIALFAAAIFLLNTLARSIIKRTKEA